VIFPEIEGGKGINLRNLFLISPFTYRKNPSYKSHVLFFWELNFPIAVILSLTCIFPLNKSSTAATKGFDLSKWFFIVVETFLVKAAFRHFGGFYFGFSIYAEEMKKLELCSHFALLFSDFFCVLHLLFFSLVQLSSFGSTNERIYCLSLFSY